MNINRTHRHVKGKNAIYLSVVLIGLALQKVINSNTQHSILTPCFGPSNEFLGLLHHSFDRYYITTKLILPEEKLFLLIK